MKNETTWMAVEGVPFLLGGALCTGLFFWFGWVTLAVISLLFSLYVIYFFRNPKRTIPQDPSAIVSPADGKVIFVGDATDPEFTSKPFTKISIFMALWDVHFNRMPAEGSIQQMKYSAGKFLAAFDEKAGEVNERQAYLIQTPQGRQLILVQIAGLIARRIVTYLKEGQPVKKGNRIGLIRFGSRCDLYFPKDSNVQVQVGNMVKGGETILATFGNGNAT